MKSIHISVHESLHESLVEVAQQQQTNKTEIVRRALLAYIEKCRQETVFKDMRAYAEEMAEHSAEFVEELDDSVTEALLNSTEW